MRSVVKLGVVLICVITLCVGCSSDWEDVSNLRQRNVVMDMELYESMKERLVRGVTLEMACELALENNLDVWLARQEAAIRDENKTASLLKMLPQFNANLHSTMRDTYSASSSLGLFSGNDALANDVQYSYSSLKDGTTGDYGVLWNIMDFGVSFFRHQQEMKRSVMAIQDLRRTRQRIVFETTQAYYRCLAFKHLAEMGTEIENSINEQVQSIENQLDKKQIGETKAIEQRYPLIAELKTINNYQEDYQTARIALARMMGLPVNSDFTLVSMPLDAGDFYFDIEELEDQALTSRPELFQQDMEEKISHDEVRLTFLQMLPTPTMAFRGNADDNPMIYYGSWTSFGLDLSWNLFALPSKFKEAKAHRMRAEFIQKKRMALAVAILWQLHMAAIEHEYALEQYELAVRVYNDCNALVENAIEAKSKGKGKDSVIVQKKVTRLQKYADYMTTFIKVMSARARILNAVGVDPNLESKTLDLNAPLDLDPTDELTPVEGHVIVSGESYPAGDGVIILEESAVVEAPVIEAEYELSGY